jgi:thiamine-phosphate pyrophosphorylase
MPNSADPKTAANDQKPLDAFPPDEMTSLLRTIDACANRAAEGLRVAEDYARFVLDDRLLTGELKLLRHELAEALASLPLSDRLAARDAGGDVGATTKTASEFARGTLANLLAANLTRAQQALRSLEEFAKLLDTSMAAKLERLRYRAYIVQTALESTSRACEVLANAHLYVLLDGRRDEASFIVTAKQLIAGGCHIIQLRDKQLDDRTLLARAKTLRQLTRGTGTLFVMNDRPDLAVLADADGIHVGQEELSVHQARTIVGTRMLVGVSTHNIEQARKAVLDEASYLGVGPTFASTTKQFEQFAGLDFVRQVAAEIRLPAFAIGGIDLNNVEQVINAGLRRVAVAGAVLNAANVTVATQTFVNALRRVPA